MDSGLRSSTHIGPFWPFLMHTFIHSALFFSLFYLFLGATLRPLASAAFVATPGQA